MPSAIFFWVQAAPFSNIGKDRASGPSVACLKPTARRNEPREPRPRSGVPYPKQEVRRSTESESFCPGSGVPYIPTSS